MITEINYDKLADLISEKLAEKMKANEDHTRSFAWARKNLFANRSYSWIKYWVIAKHPEILTENGGWLTKPDGPGKPVKVISEKAARKWLAENEKKIDWSAPEPVTIARRMGLAKPIKRNKQQ